MALTVQADQQHPSPHSTAPEVHDEGFFHYVAREGRTALRWCVGLCIVGIVAIMVSPGFFFVAIVPAAVMTVCLILLVVANIVERRSDATAHTVLEHREVAIHDDVYEDKAEADQFHPKTAAVIKRESAWAIVLLGTVVLAALFVAYWFIPTKLFAIGALVVFAYMLLLAAPVLLGAFNDDIEDAHQRLGDRPEPEEPTAN